MAFRISDQRAKTADEKMMSRRTKADLLCFFVIIVIATFFFLQDGSGEALSWDDKELVLTLSDEMVYTIPYEEITQVALVEDADIGVCLSGGNESKCQYGIWQNDTLGEYVLYAYQTSSPVIQISTAEEDYWIAIEKSDTTVAFYDAFVKMLTEAGYDIQ